MHLSVSTVRETFPETEILSWITGLNGWPNALWKKQAWGGTHTNSWVKPQSERWDTGLCLVYHSRPVHSGRQEERKRWCSRVALHGWNIIAYYLSRHLLGGYRSWKIVWAAGSNDEPEIRSVGSANFAVKRELLFCQAVLLELACLERLFVLNCLDSNDWLCISNCKMVA